MKTTPITLGLLISLLAGCSSSVQLVRKDDVGGVVALQGAYVPSMQQARMLMLEHCNGRFDTREQGARVSFRCRNAQGERHDAELAVLNDTNRDAH